jgi:hypothetical protein
MDWSFEGWKKRVIQALFVRAINEKSYAVAWGRHCVWNSEVVDFRDDFFCQIPMADVLEKELAFLLWIQAKGQDVGRISSRDHRKRGYVLNENARTYALVTALNGKLDYFCGRTRSTTFRKSAIHNLVVNNEE